MRKGFLAIFLIVSAMGLSMFFMGAKVPEKQAVSTSVQDNLPFHLTIPNTKIDYSIMQHETDDTYYLTHDEEGNVTEYGAIFIERETNPNFTDKVSVIYGHHMKDGSQFGGLSHFLNVNYLTNRRLVTLSNETITRQYRIIASHLYKDEHLSDVFNQFKDNRFYTELEHRIQQYGGVFLEEMTSNDTILVLSTCSTQGEAYRVLVYAKLIEKGSD